jgi:hypothetical protein
MMLLMTMLFTCAVSAQLRQLAVSQQTPEEMRTYVNEKLIQNPFPGSTRSCRCAFTITDDPEQRT